MKDYNKMSLFVQSLEGGGAEKMIVLLANSLADKGLKVDLIVGSFKGPYVKLVSNKVEIVKLESRGVIPTAISLCNYISRNKPSVLFSTMTGANISALLAKIASRHKFRLVISERSITSYKLNTVDTFKNRTLNYLIKWLYPKADAVVAISQGVKRDLTNKFHIPEHLITVIYNMVDFEHLDDICSNDLYEDVLRKKSNTPIIIAVGRLVKVKNYPLLINAFAKLRRKFDCKLLILGQGPEKDKIEALIAENDLINDVELLGFVDNPRQYMRMADVLVLTSNWEGFGNVLIEAMSVGTAVVSTDCESGPAEILENGKWGRLVPINDPDALSLALELSLKDDNHPNLIDRVKDFSINKITEEYYNVLLLEK